MDRGWTQNRALPGSVKQIVGTRYPPAAPKTDAPKKKDAEFHDYASSVSDVWDAGISVDNTLVNTSAAKVIQMHANGTTSKNDIVMPNCNNYPVPSKNNKIRAMQMLAMQSNPPVRPTNSIASSTPIPASGIYPRLGSDTSPASSSVPIPTRGSSTPLETADQNRFHRLSRMLNHDDAVDMEQLRENCWMGIPHALRPDAWRILSGYVPTYAARREVTLKKKRDDYWKFVEQYFHTRYDEQHHETFRQISIDVPRMSPLIPLFQQKAVQEIFERVLYIWAVRHPASGYVQGINDLVTPFFVVFLSEHISPNVDVGSFEVTQLAKTKVDLVEADSFWCVTALLDTIQDNYTFAQPGIQRKVADLKDLLSRVDPVLYKHLENNQVEFLQFAFRWMNNLLMREIPLRATIRLWDTYLSEVSGFSEFHTYVCAAFLRLWSKQLLTETDFQGIMLLLQSLPTQSWTDKQICELTADAFSLMSVFHGAKNHLNNLTPR